MQGATLLAACLAVAGWICWKKFGQRWWYIQEQRNSQAIEEMSNDDLHRLLGGKHLPSWINFPDYQRVEWVNDVIGNNAPQGYLPKLATLPFTDHCTIDAVRLPGSVGALCSYCLQFC